MIIVSLVSVAALLLQTTAGPRLPSCGSVDRDIGRGFRLTQYMFGGSPEFTLAYRPTTSSIRMVGVTETAPFHLLFSQLGIEGPPVGQTGVSTSHLGYTGYQFRKPDGVRLGTGKLMVECGGGVVLNAAFSAQPPSDAMQNPVTFHLPFLNQPEDRCMQELLRDGRFRFTIAEQDLASPSVVIEDRLDLKWALSEVERIWRAGLIGAEQGRCQIYPAPPPPF
jgi:hypothetical protein